MWIDTHAHLYAEQFDADRDEIIKRALDNDVQKIALPNIDQESMKGLFELVDKYPSICYPMLGLHPCSVDSNYLEQLKSIKAELMKRSVCAIGEIGLDFYWDKTFKEEQENAFIEQCKWAKELDLPIVIHSRDSLDRNIEILQMLDMGIKGVFHCFTGDLKQAHEIIELGFYLGIGGIVTFKNSELKNVLIQIDLKHLMVETDAPYLAPSPFRGRRNESSFVVEVGKALAIIKDVSIPQVKEITTKNAIDLFQLKQ